ncbi:MAG: hypothetical protein HC877_15950 [Thioploca sp.]|nr:hypothetical protein [Thioploca sp.]
MKLYFKKPILTTTGSLKPTAMAVSIAMVLSGTAYGDEAGKPTALFSASPMAGKAPLEVKLDASASYDDSAGKIVKYNWIDGSGTIGNGVTTTLNFTENGLYPILLMVTDNDGNTDTALRTISVGLDDCKGHATYSWEDGILYMPFVEMSMIPMIGGIHRPSQQRVLVEGSLELIQASNLFEIEDVRILSPTTLITSDSDPCHAIYSLNGQLHIPYLDIPLLTILNGIPVPFAVDTFDTTLQLIPFSDVFRIESAIPRYSCDGDDCCVGDSCCVGDDCGCTGDDCQECGDDLARQAQLMEPYTLYESINDMLVAEYAISDGWPDQLSDVITPPTGAYTEGFTLNAAELYVEATMKSEADGVLSCFAGKSIRFIYHPDLSNWTCSVNFPNGVPSEYMTFFPMSCD